MILQATAALATILGLASTWLAGQRHTSAWPTGIACCLLWIAVNADKHIWAGIASAAISAGIAARNWHTWSSPCRQPAHACATPAAAPSAAAAHTAHHTNATPATVHEGTATAAATDHTGAEPSDRSSSATTHSAASAARWLKSPTTGR